MSLQLTHGFPWYAAPRDLLRDRDSLYGPAFRNRVQAMGIEEIVTAPRSPWQNPYVERLIGSIRREMFGSHHHLQRASLARRPVELFSISSQNQNTSLTRQGLSAASPHPASLSTRDHRVPGGGRSASSLRTSRRMTSEVRQPTRPLRVKVLCIFQPLCSHATVPKNFIPMNKFQPRSSVAHFQRQVHF